LFSCFEQELPAPYSIHVPTSRIQDVSARKTCKNSCLRAAGIFHFSNSYFFLLSQLSDFAVLTENLVSQSLFLDACDRGHIILLFVRHLYFLVN
jgi:hypothetical protein